VYILRNNSENLLFLLSSAFSYLISTHTLKIYTFFHRLGEVLSQKNKKNSGPREKVSGYIDQFLTFVQTSFSINSIKNQGSFFLPFVFHILPSKLLTFWKSNNVRLFYLYSMYTAKWYSTLRFIRFGSYNSKTFSYLGKSAILMNLSSKQILSSIVFSPIFFLCFFYYRDSPLSTLLIPPPFALVSL